MNLGSDLSAIDRGVRLGELISRCMICGLAVVSIALVTTDTQVKEIFTIRKKAEFTNMRVLVFLVIANGLAAAYSLVQIVRCSVSFIRGNVLFNKPLAWAIFSGDQIMAYLMFSAIAASLQAALISQYGEPEMQWMKTCYLFKKFCNQMGEGLASSVLMCVFMAILSVISAFGLFRLYDDNSKKC